MLQLYVTCGVVLLLLVVPDSVGAATAPGIPKWHGTVRRHKVNYTRSPTFVATHTLANFTMTDTLTLSPSPDTSQSLSLSPDPTASASYGTNTATDSQTYSPSHSVSHTATLLPPIPPVPMIDPTLVAFLVASGVGVSTLAAVVARAPLHAATDLQLLVAFSMSPCANESVRMTFAWAEPILLGIPLRLRDDDLHTRGADIEAWAKGTLLSAAALWAVGIIAFFARFLWRRRSAEGRADGSLMAAMAAMYFPALPLQFTAWLCLPIWVFVGARLALFPPNSSTPPFPSTRSTSGTTVGALMLTLTPLLLRGALGCATAVRRASHVVEYTTVVFHDGFGRAAYPRAFWARTGVFAAVGHVIDFAVPSEAAAEVLGFALRTVLVSLLLSVDVTALNLAIVPHCRFFVGPAAVIMMAWPLACFAAYRGPTRHPWAALCVICQGLLCGVAMGSQVEYRWLAAFGTPAVFAAITALAGTSVCIAFMWIVEALVWIPAELKARSPYRRHKETGSAGVIENDDSDSVGLAAVMVPFPSPRHQASRHQSPEGGLQALLEFADRLPASSMSPRCVAVVVNHDSPRNPFTRLL